MLVVVVVVVLLLLLEATPFAAANVIYKLTLAARCKWSQTKLHRKGLETTTSLQHRLSGGHKTRVPCEVALLSREAPSLEPSFHRLFNDLCDRVLFFRYFCGSSALKFFDVSTLIR